MCGTISEKRSSGAESGVGVVDGVGVGVGGVGVSGVSVVVDVVGGVGVSVGVGLPVDVGVSEVSASNVVDGVDTKGVCSDADAVVSVVTEEGCGSLVVWMIGSPPLHAARKSIAGRSKLAQSLIAFFIFSNPFRSG